MTTPRLTMSPVEWAMLIALSVLWGGSFFFNGVAVRELPPFTIVFARVLIAALTLHAVMRISGRRMPRERTVIASFVVAGLLNNAIPFSLIVWGQSQIASGVASILNATTPLFTVMVAHAFTADEKLTPARISGIVAGFAGVAVMMQGPDLLTADAPVGAYAACLGAALSYGCAGVFARRFGRLGVQPMQIATGQLTASSLMLLPLMVFFDQPWTLAMPGAGAIAAVIGLATISTALAYLLFFRILAGAGAVNISLVTFLVPASAIMLGIAFLGETLEPRHIAGLALIAFGLALVDGRLVRRRAGAV